MELVGIWRKHFRLRYVPITMIQVVSAAATIFVVAGCSGCGVGPADCSRRSPGTRTEKTSRNCNPIPSRGRRVFRLRHERCEHSTKPYTRTSPNSKSAPIARIITQWCRPYCRLHDRLLAVPQLPTHRHPFRVGRGFKPNLSSFVGAHRRPSRWYVR